MAGGGGGGGTPRKSEEPQPHPPKDQLPNVPYCIISPPPWLPKRKILHNIILDLRPSVGRRSTTLVVSSGIASYLVVVFASVKVLNYFLPRIFNLFVVIVIHAVIAYVQMPIISITALGSFVNPRLVCVSSEKG